MKSIEHNIITAILFGQFVQTVKTEVGDDIVLVEIIDENTTIWSINVDYISEDELRRSLDPLFFGQYEIGGDYYHKVKIQKELNFEHYTNTGKLSTDDLKYIEIAFSALAGCVCTGHWN